MLKISRMLTILLSARLGAAVAPLEQAFAKNSARSRVTLALTDLDMLRISQHLRLAQKPHLLISLRAFKLGGSSPEVLQDTIFPFTASSFSRAILDTQSY